MAAIEGTMSKGNNGWRIARWGGAAALLCVPAVAMRFTKEVNWGPEDFIAMGGMLALALNVYRRRERAESLRATRKLFAFSILYLFVLFATLLAEVVVRAAAVSL